MLPFEIEAVDPAHIIKMSEIISDAINANYPPGNSDTNLANAVALGSVSVGFLQAIAFAMNMDETDLFEGIAEAIDDGTLPSFR